MEEVDALTPVITVLLLGILSIVISRSIRFSPIVGYLIAGIIAGPHALGLIPESDTTHLLAELGIVFLLFDIGIHFSLSNIWDVRKDIFILGPLQILLCGSAFAVIAISFQIPPIYSILLGGALALSSTAVVAQSLAERRQRNCPVGRTATAVLIFQDICAIFLLVFASTIQSQGQSSTDIGLLSEISSAFLKGLIGFLTAIILGRYFIKPLFNIVSKTKNEEIFTAIALLIVIATAASTGAIGLSLTLGAFLGGMMISESPHRHVIQTEAKPFRNLLLAFFFISVGMSLDWRILIEYWLHIIIFIIFLLLIKAILISISAQALGWSLPGSIQLGSLLAQGSEFVFVILAVPQMRGALGEQASGVVITGVAASLALTPALAKIGNKFARFLWSRSSASAPTSEITPVADTPPVVIFGMDEVGRMVADALEANNIAYDAIEMDYDRFVTVGSEGYPVAFGDLADMRLMETIDYAERSAILVTIVRYELLKPLQDIVASRYPNLTRFIAVDSDDEAKQYKKIGMRPIVNRSTPKGIDTVCEILRSQGIEENKIQSWVVRRQSQALEAENNI
ncbi:cation:proton antiporter [Microbulbifer sp. CnH-101-E]|uniref:cation:proton antiporter domain-containing protein n=1 Tax=unclassified Microbulbifer TaxID=2619833 RepID=UPI004039C67C